MQPLIPEWFVSAFAAATVFTVMFGLGLGLRPREFLLAWRRPQRMLVALFAVLVAVPVLAIVVARGLRLPLAAEVGIALMAIAPGAPIALQRSLGAGAERCFAPGLQVTVALAAVVSMPASVALLDQLFNTNAVLSHWHVMKQVSVVQLLPLATGVAIGRLLPGPASRLAAHVERFGKLLLLVLVGVAVAAFWTVIIAAGPAVALAAALTTAAALAVGHWLGGEDPGTRTAVAIASAARNPGLALLVASLNSAPPAVKATLLSYMVVAAFTVLPYAMLRGRGTRTLENPETGQ
jgi:BASS family bile acid:Na+ symporter